jgi:hypothetical protein
MVCRRLIWCLGMTGLVSLGWSAALQAKCGDAPGDPAAIAAARAAIEAQCPCAGATSRGDYVRCAKGVVNAAVADGTLPRNCAGTVKRCASKSTCGRPTYVTCCRTTASGKTKCSVKKDASKCRAPSGGQSCTSGFTSCCDACAASGCVPTDTPAPTATPTPSLTRTITATPTVTETPTIPPICVPMAPLPTPIAQVPITLGVGSSQCGGAMLMNPAPLPPFAGSVADGGNMSLGDLSVGCLYAGGLPGLRLPDGSSAQLDVVGFNLLPLALTLTGSEGSGPSDCTKGSGPGFACANGKPGIDGLGTCNSDNDCAAPTACQPRPNCFFGPPIPVPNGGLSACVISAFRTDLCGQVTLVPPAATFATALSSFVYLTLNADSPCPRCESGVCNGGERAGLSCTPIGTQLTSVDCPPERSTFIATLNVVVPELTSGTSTLTAPDGFFCDGQMLPGAMGIQAVRTVSETGTSPALNGLSLEMNLAGTFCIPPSGTVVDVLGGLPGVGALSAVGQVDLTALLAP